MAQQDDFSESFTNTKNGWMQYKGSQVSCSFQKGSYSMRNGSDAPIQIRTPYFYSTADNFFFKTDITIKGNNTGAWNGFYLNTDSTAYLFQFNRNKEAQIVKRNLLNGRSDTLFYKERVKKIKADALETNRLALKCIDGKLQFTVNKGKAGFITLSARRIVEMGYSLAPRNDVRVEAFTADVKPSIKRIALVNDTNILKCERSTALGGSSDEEHPVVSPDSKFLFFSSIYRSESIDMNSGKRSKDIYFATKNSDGTWGEPVRAQGDINNEFDNEVVGISPDNQTLLLTGKYRRPGSQDYLEAPLFFSTREVDGTWGYPEPLYIISSYNNSAVQYNGFSLSANGKTLILSAKRDDTNGGYDLYIAFSEDGSYFGEPRNMGNLLNSKGDETTPYLAADGRTLYFSSNGYVGYGKADVYISHRQGEEWETWTAPENMGPAINSPLDDVALSADASGEYAYISSREGAIGESDIFRVSLPQSIRSEPVAIVYGRVLDAQNNNPIITTVNGLELPGRLEVGSTISGLNNGAFALTIPLGSKYEITAKEKGYFALSERLDLTQKMAFNRIERNLFLFPIKLGEPIRLGNQYFVQGTAELNEATLGELERITGLLVENPGMRVLVDASYSKTLQTERERSIGFYLYTQGLNPKMYLLKPKRK